jgi:hypothetical protein
LANLGDDPERATLPPAMIWGAGRRARAWAAAIAGGGLLRVAGVIGRGDGGIEGWPSLPRFSTLDEALGARVETFEKPWIAWLEQQTGTKATRR